jgi:Xaa-Pro aminopeptidase
MSIPVVDRTAGARRAASGARAGLRAATALIARADAQDGLLWIDGSPLTSDRVREEIRAAFADLGVEAEEVTVSHGPQSADPDSLGDGPVHVAAPVVLDLYPRDLRSGMHADLARTVAVDPPEELRGLHTTCLAILHDVAGEFRAGASVEELWRRAAAAYARAGARPRHEAPAGATWFPPLLAHGVGESLHASPLVGAGASGVLRAGDLLACEPALYHEGLGGCRIENLYLITDDGSELLTDCPTGLEPEAAGS